MTDRDELLRLRAERLKANEAQRLWKLRKYSDEALQETKEKNQQRIRDIEKVQKERE